jgi:hypothetical protein
LATNHARSARLPERPPACVNSAKKRVYLERQILKLEDAILRYDGQK